MGITSRDKEFRTPKTTYIDFKHIEMDRVLTMLFPRLKFDGYGSRRVNRGADLTVEDFLDEMLDHPEWFTGFDSNKDLVRKWIETDLMDVVNRGKANQAVASPRPLHGNTYKFRNVKHTRDYGAAEQIYWMLYHARKGGGQTVRTDLKNFFFAGVDLVTDRITDCCDQLTIDVETQSILRLDQQVQQDIKDSKKPSRDPPLCIGQADLLANDIIRLLAYEPYIPRSVLVEYLKTLFAFHLAIYHLKILYLLPKTVKKQAGNPICSKENCPVNPAKVCATEGCPFQIALLIDMEDPENRQMSELATKSAGLFYRQIPSFIQANFVVKKLDEMADYLCNKTGKIASPSGDSFDVFELLQLLASKYKADRDAYFKYRLTTLIEEATAGSEDIDPEIQKVTSMRLNEFDTYIEILMAYRAKYHTQYITECLDSLMLKNKESGLLAQTRTKGSPRRFVMGSKLLEVLLQLAVLTQKDGHFVTRKIRIEELLEFLRERYGIYIDRLPDFDNDHYSDNILNRKAMRRNAEAFKKRLREIGFYEDLSDAYITQKVYPRYTISIENGKNS